MNTESVKKYLLVLTVVILSLFIKVLTYYLDPNATPVEGRR